MKTSSPAPSSWFRPVARRVALVGAAFLLVTSAGRAELTGAVEQHPARLLVHLRAFQEIADASGGNRASGTQGYDGSADYVAERLRQAGYELRSEEFTFPFFEELSPPVLTALSPSVAEMPADPESVRTLVNSGSAEVLGQIKPVALGLVQDTPPQASASGCAPQDFAGLERGAVALVRRGTCPFQAKVENAAAAGAVGVVIMNEGTEGRTGGLRGTLMRSVNIPVIGVPFALGRSLASAAAAPQGVSVRLAVNARTGTRTTRNVVAETGPDQAETIVVGAHLDSVPEGPGINDNGSGSAAVLEAALRLAKGNPQRARRVRFAFWGAEERGLIGSRHHVTGLSAAERSRIGVYINLDMVGSPNFARMLAGPEAGPGTLAGAARQALVAYFADRGIPLDERRTPTPRHSGSDDASFAEKNIPALGLYTGAAEPKSDTHARMFGGTAGRPHDPCYHQACDTVGNVQVEVLEEMTAALAHTLGVLARP